MLSPDEVKVGVCVIQNTEAFAVNVRENIQEFRLTTAEMFGKCSNTYDNSLKGYC